jgi:hypothetical protein
MPDRGLGRLSWADSAPARAALRTTAVRAIAVIPWQARIGFTVLLRSSKGPLRASGNLVKARDLTHQVLVDSLALP